MTEPKKISAPTLTEKAPVQRTPSPQEESWEQDTLAPALEKNPERQAQFTTISGHPIRRLYTEADLSDWKAATQLGFPGEPPYTRGIHSTMHRGRLWTMRQFAGFGAAEDTNQRFRYLLSQGQTGLSTAFDLPTLMGYDSDHALSEGEVGKCGVAVSSLADMEVLFDQIPLADVTTSMTINSPAAVIWAMYLAVAEKQGADWKKISGTLQNDILKEYIAQKEYIYPPEPSMRLVIDTFEFAVKETPKFNPISVSGYHIREAGSTAAEELVTFGAPSERIRNGEVCYWPNLGYGRFGAKVSMSNAPLFDTPDLFDQKRLRLADIDGSGTTDIVYLGRTQVTLYFNQAGNRWSGPQALTQFPAPDNVASVATVDLLGNGTACLVWSSPLPGDAGRQMRFESRTTTLIRAGLPPLGGNSFQST